MLLPPCLRLETGQILGLGETNLRVLCFWPDTAEPRAHAALHRQEHTGN